MYSVIDLFAGAGGLSLGFQQTKKYCIKVAFENNPSMQETYRLNHSGVDVRGDIRNANYTEIQEKYGTIDVVIGGPPCQGFSNANRQKNHAISHKNILVKEYIRAIRELKPKAFVMENVSMLRSDVHRFYMSENDRELVERGVLDTKITPIPLLDADFIFDGVLEVIKDEETIKKFIWPDIDYLELNVIYKSTKNPKKLLVALKKHEKHLTAIAEEHVKMQADSAITKADVRAFSAILRYYKHGISSVKLLPLIKPAIMYQRMLSHALEIVTNDLVVDNYSLKNGLSVEVRSFAVLDYIKAMLENREGADGYTIADDILNAADFGAPQKRMRFILLGIRKDLSKEVQLPKGKFEGGPYRTVRDAISDLEDIEPVFDAIDDVGIRLKKKEDLSDLAKSLRDRVV